MMETPSMTPTPEPIPVTPKKSNTGLIIGIVVVVLLCCCCLLSVGLYWGYTTYYSQLMNPTGWLLNLI
jgi:hypothetical protein